MKKEERERYERKTAAIEELKRWEATTVDYWKERMQYYPDAVSAELQGVIEGMKGRNIDRKNEHKRMARDQYSNQDEAAQVQEMIDRYNAVIEKLKNLVDSKETFEAEKYLSDECIADLEKLAKLKENQNIGINEFFKVAHTIDTCRKNANGKKISWSTLRAETEKVRPDIYYRNIKPRK